MEEQIMRFAEQFAWEPSIENAGRLPANFSHVIVCGMGGSHLGARLLLRHDPMLPVSVHSDYGLPRESREHLASALIVASSYSGETEETLDAARAAADAGLAVAVVTTGGALEAFARERSLPLILMPKEHAEPRMAVGAQMLALARLSKDTELESAIRAEGSRVDAAALRAPGAALAQKIGNKTPIIYASNLNAPLAYFWKIALNETGKIPAFYNLFPELCHNELSGFDMVEATRAQVERLHVVELEDADDHPRIQARMKIMRELLAARNVDVSLVPIEGTTALDKAFSGLLAGVWTAFALAHASGAPDAATPLIAEFKEQMHHA